MLKFTGFIDLTDKDRHTSSIVLKQHVHMEQLDYFASSLRYNELIACACFYPTFFLTLCVIRLWCMKTTDTISRLFISP